MRGRLCVGELCGARSRRGKIPSTLGYLIAQHELGNKKLLYEDARLSSCDLERPRFDLLKFLDTDLFNVPAEDCDAVRGSIVKSWDIDPFSFSLEALLKRRLVPGQPPRL